jgi:hypothetical protein
MEPIIIETTPAEIFAMVFAIITMIVMIVIMICTVVGDEFYGMPVIYQWLTLRRNLYKTGYKDGLDHKTIKEYDLKRDRKIRRLENKIYRAQQRFDEFYITVQKDKFQREEE